MGDAGQPGEVAENSKRCPDAVDADVMLFEIAVEAAWAGVAQFSL